MIAVTISQYHVLTNMWFYLYLTKPNNQNFHQRQLMHGVILAQLWVPQAVDHDSYDR